MTVLSARPLRGATVSIVAAYAPGHDALQFTNTGNISGVWDGASGTLTLSGDGSALDYQAALRSVTYVFTGGHPIDRARQVSIAVEDDIGVGPASLRAISLIAPPLPSTPTPAATTSPGANALGGDGALPILPSPTLPSPAIPSSAALGTSDRGAAQAPSAAAGGGGGQVPALKAGATGIVPPSAPAATVAGRGALAGSVVGPQPAGLKRDGVADLLSAAQQRPRAATDAGGLNLSRRADALSFDNGASVSDGPAAALGVAGGVDPGGARGPAAVGGPNGARGRGGFATRRAARGRRRQSPMTAPCGMSWTACAKR